ncbi:hypothetical protein TNCT_142011 [Trichonephila clavata]|uniref:Uncharacterized protein n=1 Tax=Trichonephila clavata TaxID=2740835 RepID=A0A8X6KED1_TRICU|nr:hypothetical protein TNCT_142011 [Trichonephila clavata]
MEEKAIFVGDCFEFGKKSTIKLFENLGASMMKVNRNDEKSASSIATSVRKEEEKKEKEKYYCECKACCCFQTIFGNYRKLEEFFFDLHPSPHHIDMRNHNVVSYCKQKV